MAARRIAKLEPMSRIHPMIRLETPRLRVRHFTPDDARSLYDLDHDPLVMRFIGPYTLDSVAAYRQRIAEVYAPYAGRDDGLGLWVVEERSTARFLGWVCLRPAEDYRFATEAGFEKGDAELGYRLCSADWNRGYATEASRELIGDVRRRNPAGRIVSTALETNRASIRVMQNCGLRWTNNFALPGFDVLSVRYQLPALEIG